MSFWSRPPPPLETHFFEVLREGGGGGSKMSKNDPPPLFWFFFDFESKKCFRVPTFEWGGVGQAPMQFIQLPAIFAMLAGLATSVTP